MAYCLAALPGAGTEVSVTRGAAPANAAPGITPRRPSALTLERGEHVCGEAVRGTVCSAGGDLFRAFLKLLQAPRRPIMLQIRALHLSSVPTWSTRNREQTLLLLLNGSAASAEILRVFSSILPPRVLPLL